MPPCLSRSQPLYRVASMLTPMAAFLVVSGTATTFGGCNSEPRPWSAPPSQSVVDATIPFLPARPKPGASAAGSGDPTGLAGPARPTSRVGGLWVGCYGGFRPGKDPKAAVTALGLLCGPSNGMEKMGGLHQGQVRAGGPRHHRFRFAAGACVRVFAVSAASIPNLNVEVRVGESVVGRDTGDDRWPVVQAERPICFRRDSEVDVVVSTTTGSGPYALELWTLRPQHTP